MGCGESTIQPYPLCRNLSIQRKGKLIEAIEADDIAVLAQFQAKEDFPSNVELSEDGTMWTSIHFCCRFDSASCLDFLLKKCYLENVKQYIHLVNRQTSEGLTPLHLCGLWNSFKCFALLTKYGGLNLSAVDSKFRTAESVMKGKGLKAMEDTVGRLKEREGAITEWNYKLLHEFVDIPKLRSLQYHQQQIVLIQNKKKRVQTQVTRSQHQNQAKLWEQKGKLQLQSRQLYNQINSKLQKLQKERPLTQSKKNTQSGSFSPVFEEKIIKNQEILGLQRQLQEKQQQIQEVKLSIKKLKTSKIEGAVNLENQKIALQTQQTEESLSQFARDFSAYKQTLTTDNISAFGKGQPKDQKSINKEKEIKGSNNSNNSLGKKQVLGITNDANFTNLPQNIKERYKRAKAKGSFEDEQFPHNESSFGGQKYRSRIQQMPEYVWLRPTDFIGPDFVLFDGIDPEDIKQRILGICYFLATLTYLAKYPQRVKQLFLFADLQIGFYVLRLYTNGKPNYIVLDDYFPCYPTYKKPIFCQPNGKEIWVLLLEKAWSKSIGSYCVVEGLGIACCIEDISQSPAIFTYFEKQVDKMKKVAKYCLQNKLIVLYIKDKNVPEGLVSPHCYALMNVYQHNQNYLYKIRNPMGFLQWNGQYGQQSPLWTPQLRKKCSQTNGDDGVFFMTQRQIVRYCEGYTVQLGQPNSKYSYLQFQSQPEEKLYFRFQLTKKGMMAVKVTQPFDVQQKEIDSSYKYSPVIFELGKIVNGSVIFLSQGNDSCYCGDKNVFACEQVYKQYEAGDYFVRITVEWNNPKKYHTAVLSVYCGQSVTIQRIKQPQGFKMWKQLVCSFMKSKQRTNLNQNIAYGIEWMMGQTVYLTNLRQNSENSFKIKWKFDSKLFSNCKLDISKANENQMEFFINKDERQNFGTIHHTNISEKCHYGLAQINFFPI